MLRCDWSADFETLPAGLRQAFHLAGAAASAALRLRLSSFACKEIKKDVFYGGRRSARRRISSDLDVIGLRLFDTRCSPGRHSADAARR